MCDIFNWQSFTKQSCKNTSIVELELHCCERTSIIRVPPGYNWIITPEFLHENGVLMPYNISTKIRGEIFCPLHYQSVVLFELIEVNTILNYANYT